MKCADCLSFQMVKNGLTKPSSIGVSLTLANDAVTIVDGKALCNEHFVIWIKE